MNEDEKRGLYAEYYSDLEQRFTLEDCYECEYGGRCGHLKANAVDLLDKFLSEDLKMEPEIHDLAAEQCNGDVGCYTNYLGGGMGGRIVPITPTREQLFGDDPDSDIIDSVMAFWDAFRDYIPKFFYALEDNHPEYPDGETNWEYLSYEQRQGLPVSGY